MGHLITNHEHVFFSFTGVVTYVKEELSPLDAHANSLGDSDDPLLDELSNEGRMVETDHGSFVLINVYLPNAGDKEQGRPRLHFKLAFLEALKNKCTFINFTPSYIRTPHTLYPHTDVFLLFKMLNV